MPNGSVGHVGDAGPTPAPVPATASAPASTGGSGWTGVVVFAAILLVVAGVVQSILGISAIVNEDWVVWDASRALFVDLNTWGWAHAIWGGVLFLAGLGLLTGNIIARLFAIFVASVSLIGNFFFIPEAPVWSIVLIAIDIIIIWAVAAHGDDLKRPKTV